MPERGNTEGLEHVSLLQRAWLPDGAREYLWCGVGDVCRLKEEKEVWAEGQQECLIKSAEAARPLPS